MPREDQTGPNGQGSQTGRGLGRCNVNQSLRGGRGGQGRGFRRMVGQGNNIDKEVLQNHIEELESQLEEAKQALKKTS